MLTIEKNNETLNDQNIEQQLSQAKLLAGLVKSDAKLVLTCQSLERMKNLPKHEITNWTWGHQFEQ